MSETTASWNTFTSAFYNIKNLFDIRNEPTKYDDDCTPKGKLKWNKTQFEKKIQDLETISHQIGKEETEFPPVIASLAEIENADVLQALINSEGLKKYNYGSVHFESKDERGINTALLFRKQYFKVASKKAHNATFKDAKGEKDYTRDILEVTGTISGQKTTIILNHRPSRLAGC